MGPHRFGALFLAASLLSPPAGSLCLAQAHLQSNTDTLRYHFGNDPKGGNNWTDPSFDDSSWPKANRGRWPLPAFYSDQRLGKNAVLDLRAMNFASEPTVKIPASAARLLVQILDEMSRGNAVKIVPIHAELTTQEAADLLNVSRPTLIQILEQGQIPFRKVGTHRRILFAKAMEYKRKVESDRKAALAELVAYDQEIGL